MSDVLKLGQRIDEPVAGCRVGFRRNDEQIASLGDILEVPIRRIGSVSMTVCSYRVPRFSASRFPLVELAYGDDFEWKSAAVTLFDVRAHNVAAPEDCRSERLHEGRNMDCCRQAAVYKAAEAFARYTQRGVKTVSMS